MWLYITEMSKSGELWCHNKNEIVVPTSCDRHDKRGGHKRYSSRVATSVLCIYTTGFYVYKKCCRLFFKCLNSFWLLTMGILWRNQRVIFPLYLKIIDFKKYNILLFEKWIQSILSYLPLIHVLTPLGDPSSASPTPQFCVILKKALSPLYSVYILLGMGSFAGAWLTNKGPDP